MIEPVERILQCFDGRRRRRRRAAQHNHANAQRARSGDLAVGGAAAAVLGDHGLDAMLGHQRPVIRFTEWAATSHVSHVWQKQRRIDRVDAADQIKVLRGLVEWRKLVAAERNKDAARHCLKRAHCLTHVAYFGPSVASGRDPWRSPQHQQRDAGLAGSFDGIVGYDASIGMRGIDQKTNALARQIVGESRSAAEATAAHGHGLACRRSGAAGKRKRHIEFGPACQPLRQQSRFRGAAENEDALHAAA